MEMKVSNDTSNDPLNNQSASVEIIDPSSGTGGGSNYLQYRQKLLYKYRRNFFILSISILLIFLLIIIIFFSFSKSLCSRNSSNTPSDPSKSSLNSGPLLDLQNKSCFYTNIRLPTSITPTNYRIFLHPNISEIFLIQNRAYYKGFVEIDCKCSESTNYIVLHAKEMDLTAPKVIFDNDEVEIEIESFCPKLDQYYLKVARHCRIGSFVKLNISFYAILTKRLNGFYLSDYKTKSGETKTLITTHMEPTFARLAFPCFDEPYFKANFSLQMVRDAQHHTLFNMPLKSTIQLSNGYYLDSYYSTVKMSTYLVAYMLLPLDYIYVEGFDAKNKVKIRIYAPSDQKTYTKHALEVSTRVLPFFEDLFGLEYPLPKLDMIGIPDFSAGAMENWGLVTYKMFALLINPDSKKVLHRSSIAKIISHEIAHQWFGNIVTMDWWNDLWLNEGFASYSEYLGGDFANKDWKMMEQFYLDQYKEAMSFDSLVNSHPIQVPVNDPEEIESIFDQISYGKGASLVRMLEGVLGMPVLKRGLSIYLNRYRYKNAISDSLWVAFSEAYLEKKSRDSSSISHDTSNPLLNLKRVMATWLNQMNYPLVTIKRTSSNSFKITQSRFLIYPNSTSLFASPYDSPFNYLWCIPILYITDQMKKPQLIWLDLVKSREIKLDHDFKWIKLNYGQTGFYRVLYDDREMYDELIRVMKTDINTFSSVDRAGIISDLFVLSRVGLVDLSIGLELGSYLEQEMDLIPWCIAADAFYDIIQQLYLDMDILKKFRKYGEGLIKKTIESGKVAAWDNVNLTPYETLVQSSIYHYAVVFRNERAWKLAKESYRQFKQYNITLNTNLHSLSLYSAIVDDDGTEWDYLYKLMITTKNSDSRRTLRRVLAKTRDLKRLNKLFVTVMIKFKHQDLVSVLVEASQRNAAGLDQAWLFLQRHWKYFQENISQQYFLIAELFKICNGLMTEFDYQQAKSFFSSNNLGTGARSALQSLEMIKSNIYWNQKNLQPLKEWLNKRFP